MEHQLKIFESDNNTKTCSDCFYLERWECESKVFHYCGIRESKKTLNGLKKRKCKDLSCDLFKSKYGKPI
jgi:hypothetical protein